METRQIHNFEALAENETRFDALMIAEAGYAAINTAAALTRRIHIEGDTIHIDDAQYLLDGRRVFFVGIGKCALVAAEAIEQLFGDHLEGGIALDVSSRDERPLKKIVPYIGTHPLPSDTNEEATRQITNLLDSCTKDDLVIVLVSGGGSTLLCSHEAPMTCLDESTLFSELTARGASIQEINTVRKHISFARGGGLAKAAYPAEVISLIISDVPGNNIEFIASGPTVKDDSTIGDAQAVLSRYGIEPSSAVTFIETPKEDQYFENVTNTLFLTNQNALQAMQEEAKRRGYAATIMSDHISGEAHAVAKTALENLHDAPDRSVFLYAGETTVTLGKEHGAGGRNQEMALAGLAYLKRGELLLPIASDGHDNSDHAGAICDAVTHAHAYSHELSPADYLADHRSYDFFATTGDALRTGYTGSNVSDLIITIKN